MSHLSGPAYEPGTLVSNEYINGNFQKKHGDIPEPLHELAGSLARAIVKEKKAAAKMTQQHRRQTANMRRPSSTQASHR